MNKLTKPSMKSSAKNGSAKKPKEIAIPMQAIRVPFPAGPGEAVRNGIMVYGNVLVGPNSSGDLIVKAEMTPPVFFTVPRPRIIELQPRQSDNNDFGFPDQFALMVIETAIDFVRFRIRRLDNGANATGWGQNLQVDIFCIDDGTDVPFGG